MFLFKQSEVVVDCFTSNDIAHHSFKIDRARAFIPREWKELPVKQTIKIFDNPKSKATIEVPNLKQCLGFTDLFAQGFIIPSWVDIQIEMLADGQYNVFGHNKPMVNIEVGHHGRNQYGNLYKQCGHIKITSPWFFEEKQGIKFSWNPCMWNGTHHKGDMHILSGVVDYKYQRTTNINAFIKFESIVKLDSGEPLVHLIPLSDKKVKIRNHLLTDEEFRKRFAIELQASNYNNPRNVKKPKESKCPFGFGR